MKEHPILFSAPMVRAILDGRKTQTRRIVKPALPAHINHMRPWFLVRPGVWIDADGTNEERRCPYGVPGDRLWVRETFQIRDTIKGRRILVEQGSEKRNGRCVNYRADAENVLPWRPSIHMPRWASRITLEVTDVRVERLLDIIEEDARAEGCVRETLQEMTGEYRSARDNFSILWESINGPGAWRANPWVWAITFKRVAP